MTKKKKQNRKSRASGWICASLGSLLLAGVVPVASRAQNSPRVVAPQAHPWANNTTAKNETKVSGTIQQVISQHGSSQIVIEGANGAVTADLGPAARNAARSFSAGDRVEIAGWMRTDVLVARQITASERQVVIRNQHGMLVHPVPATSTKPQRVGASFTGGAR